MLSIFVTNALLTSPTMLDFYTNSDVDTIRSNLTIVTKNFERATIALNSMTSFDTSEYKEALCQCVIFDILIRIAQECADYKYMYGSDALKAFIRLYIQEQNRNNYNKAAGG